VTLTTSKHQEAWAYAQLNLDAADETRDRLLRPDWDPERELPFRTVRPECLAVLADLPHLRPAALWVFGARSPLSSPEAQDEKMAVTGVGVSGSGGKAAGKVQRAVLDGAGHLLVFEHVPQSARVGAEWIAAALARWSDEERALATHRNPKSVDGMLRISDEWVATMKLKLDTPRPRSEKL
jgi:hypothetical protein